MNTILSDHLCDDHCNIIRPPCSIGRFHQILTGTMKVWSICNGTIDILLIDHPPQTITTNHKIHRRMEWHCKDISFQALALTQSTYQHIAMRESGSFILAEVSEFFKALDQ